jgi:hypothetical protein
MFEKSRSRRFAVGLLGGAAFSMLLASAFSAAPAEGKKTLQVVVHVNFPDAQRQGHGLKNVENILKDVHEDAKVEVVCHGAGIGLLVKNKTEMVRRWIKNHSPISTPPLGRIRKIAG